MLLSYFITVVTNFAEFCAGPAPMHLVVPAPAVRKLEGVLFPWVFVWIRPLSSRTLHVPPKKNQVPGL